MKYFQLNPECYLVTGTKKSLIHNLLTGQIMWLEINNTKQILLAEAGSCIDENETTFKELEKLGWGFFSDSKYFIDKLRPTNIYNENKVWKNNPNLVFATIQITDKCNSKCSFCNDIFCPVCLKSANEQFMDKNILFDLINNSVFYGLKEVLLTGGEPLLHKNIEEICSSIIKKGVSLSVKTNGLIKPGNLPKNIKFIVLLDDVNNLNQIANNYKGYENVTILKAKNKEDNFVALNIPKNWNVQPFTINQTIKKDTMKGLNMEEFFLKKLNNPCLASKITVMSNGNVVPCLQNIQEVIGNIEKDEFSQIIKNLSLKYWSKPIEQRKTGKCSKCEFMYACNSCLYTNCEKTCPYDVEASQWK